MTVPNKIWAEARLYSPAENGRLLEALMQYHEGIENDNKATLIWHSVDQGTLLVFFYCAPVENPDIFAPFKAVPYMAHVVEPGCRTIYEMVQAVADILQSETQW